MDYEKAIRELAKENPDFKRAIEEKFPEAFKSKTINLYEANGSKVVFMSDILRRVGLDEYAIQIARDWVSPFGIKEGSALYFSLSYLKEPRKIETSNGWLVTVEPKE